MLSTKEQLPAPYDEDLSEVLAHLNRRGERARHRLANDPVTAAYLAAAVRLVERQWGTDRQAEALTRALPFLSQRSVAAEMSSNPYPFPRQGSVATLRSTWRTQADFTADLLGFMLWTGYYPLPFQQVFEQSRRLLEGPTPLAEAVQQVARAVTEQVLAMTAFRLQVATVLEAVDGSPVRAVFAAKYQRGRNIWSAIYQTMMTERGLRLREGITLDELTDLLTATIEGCGLRALALGPAGGVIDADGVRSLLGTAAVAVLNGCLVPADGPDRQSLYAALDALEHPGHT